MELHGKPLHDWQAETTNKARDCTRYADVKRADRKSADHTLSEYKRTTIQHRPRQTSSTKRITTYYSSFPGNLTLNRRSVDRNSNNMVGLDTFFMCRATFSHIQTDPIRSSGMSLWRNVSCGTFLPEVSTSLYKERAKPMLSGPQGKSDFCLDE